MNPTFADKHTLVRGLGLIAAVSVIIGNVIGTGVFLKARVMTCNVGTPTWVLAAWIAAGLLSLAGALTYAELTAMKPQAGGEYVFLRDAYGKAFEFFIRLDADVHRQARFAGRREHGVCDRAKRFHWRRKTG